MGRLKKKIVSKTGEQARALLDEETGTIVVAIGRGHETEVVGTLGRVVEDERGSFKVEGGLVE